MFIVLVLPTFGNATIQTYDDKSTFLSDTGSSSATGTLPDIGIVPGGEAQSQTVGSVTFTSFPTGRLYVGAKGVTNDWTARLPGPDIAVSDVENLNADFAAPVYACGFDFVKPWNDPNALAEPGPSTFTVTLLNRSATVGSFTYTPPYDQALFYGVWSDTAFTRMEIRETIGGIDNEFWNQFYTGTTPMASPPVPLPSTLLLLGSGLLSLVGWRSFRKG